MNNCIINVPKIVNEPIKEYRPGSPEAESLKKTLHDLSGRNTEIFIKIAGQTITSDRTAEIYSPSTHDLKLGTYHCAGQADAKMAINASKNAHESWSSMPWQARAAIFLKAADLAAGPWRDRLNAATMLGQGKTVHQAEIDSACELIDFFRFNVSFMRKIYQEQSISSAGIWNYQEYCALQGFVFAVTPFNFTAIAANLPTAPALMGNTVIWKPSERSLLSSHVVMELLEEAGLPDGVINFLPTDKPGEVGDTLIESQYLAGIHFTGSTKTFQDFWRHIGNNISRYTSYPRIVGETGGKDFIFAHPTANIEALVIALIRGSFEYQGQKCSATSRGYIPGNIWDSVIALLKEKVAEIKVATPQDFSNFMGPVIDKRAFDSINEFISFALDDSDHEILIGGNSDDSIGYYIYPTVIISKDPHSRLMTEEIFGPVLTLYRYDENRIDEAINDCDTATQYALTGAIFAQDRQTLVDMTNRFRYSAGNFYINDKPTGAVVGQQPFGGGRSSGTNDKAGSLFNLLRWVNVRTIKETFVPDKDYKYPYMS